MSATKKQTAIEWLMDKLPHSIECWYSKQIEQAKEMEKEQIMDAYEQGNENGYWHPENGWNKTFENPKQYYNKTYNNNDKNSS